MRTTTIERIHFLTKVDLVKKTIFELLASATEELGEFARELKIEEKTFGNTYKKADEGTKTEAVDLIVCGLSLFFARGGTIDELDTIVNSKLNKWEESQHGA